MQYEPRYKTLLDIFDESMKNYGPRELFGTKKSGHWHWTSYSEFGSQVGRLRGGFASLGIKRGDCVAIIADNRVEWAVIAYACSGLGAAFVPMYQAQDPKDWEYIVRDCEAKALVVANETVLAKTKGLLEGGSLKNIVLLESATRAESANGSTRNDDRVVTYASLAESGKRADATAVRPEETAALLYTSGTTGSPKGVVLTHFNLAANVSATLELFPSLTCADRSLAFLPWAHALGQTGELHSLFSRGASIGICEGTEKILANLAEVRPTVLFSVPRVFNKLYTAVQQQLADRPKPVRQLVERALDVAAKGRQGRRLGFAERLLIRIADALVFTKVRARLGGRLRYAVAGGASLSLEVAEFLDSLGIVVFEGYGLTETSPVVTVNAPGARKLGSVGRPIPGVRVAIDPTTEQNVADDQKPNRAEGEVIVYGHNVMKGYFNHPSETASVLTADGGLRTGDMGYVDADGYLFLTGRIKEQYKLENGKYVVPTLLEEQLKLSPYVVNVMIHGENRPFNVALIVANAPAVRKWAADHQVLLPEDVNDLLADNRVRLLFKGEIEKYQSRFKSFEWIREFALTSSDFTSENGMLTPSLKLKRRVVVQTYGEILDDLYAKGKGERPLGPRTATA